MIGTRVLTQSRMPIARFFQTSSPRVNKSRTPPWKDIIMNRAKGARL